MQLINEGPLKILIPDEGYKLVHKESGNVMDKVYLCMVDDPDNYTEVVDEKYISVNYIVDFSEFKEEMNNAIDVLAETVDEIYTMFEPLMIDTFAMQSVIVSPMVKFYILLIQRGLKDIEDIPDKFKEEVLKLL